VAQVELHPADPDLGRVAKLLGRLAPQLLGGVELVRLLEDGQQAQVHRLGVVGLRGLLEDGVERLGRAVGVFEVEQRDPHVHALLLLAEGDDLERSARHLARLVNVRELQLEGHELDPEIRRVRRAEQQPLKVGRRLGRLGCQVCRHVLLRRGGGLGLALLGLAGAGLRRLVVIGLGVRAAGACVGCLDCIGCGPAEAARELESRCDGPRRLVLGLVLCGRVRVGGSLAGCLLRLLVIVRLNVRLLLEGRVGREQPSERLVCALKVVVVEARVAALIVAVIDLTVEVLAALGLLLVAVSSVFRLAGVAVCHLRVRVCKVLGVKVAGLQAEAQTLLLAVDLEHDGAHTVANRKRLERVRRLVVRELCRSVSTPVGRCSLCYSPGSCARGR
jgi:hypothetical protein